jgi:cobyrinic acid a,c-diamide synthase
MSGPRGLILAAARSGAGKTTVALALMRALSRRGLAVQPFKCGPDYIDGAHHRVAAGRTSLNLDPWSMHPTLLARLVHEGAAGADITIAEGVMGLFDGAGASGQSGRGSTADLAAHTGWPVVLVLDVAGQGETAAAVAAGCAAWREDIAIAGVILNRLAGPRHLALIAPALERTGIPLLGSLARDPALVLPERHLGLVQAGELADADRRMDALADALAAGVDLDGVVRAARPAAALPADGPWPRLTPPGRRIALAGDAAFSFVYPHLLLQWRAAGAEVLPFSPLADEPPDPAADAVWLPGGYPELHAEALAAAHRFKTGLAAAADRGVPIHGECGGYMVLGRGLTDEAGRRHEMAGLLDLETSFARRALHLGYRRATLRQACGLGRAGTTVLGHEFHYATMTAGRDDPLVECRDAPGALIPEGGACRGSVSGTFFHMVDREGA